MFVRYAKAYYKTFLMVMCIVLLLYVCNNFNAAQYVNAQGLNFYALFTESFGDASSYISNVDGWFNTWTIDADKWYSFLNFFNLAMRSLCDISLFVYGVIKFVFNIMGIICGWGLI